MADKFIVLVGFSAHAVILSLEHTVIFWADARLATGHGIKLCAVLESEHTSFSFSLLLYCRK